MENFEMTHDDSTKMLIGLPDVAKFTSIVLFISVLFGLIETVVYYHLMLHVPIFQYFDVSEMVIIDPATAIILTMYLIGNNAMDFFANQPNLNLSQRLSFALSALTFVVILSVIAYQNDLVFREIVLLPLRHWYYILAIFVILSLLLSDIERLNYLKKKYSIYLPIIWATWFGMFAGYCKYTSLVDGKIYSKVICKIKSGTTFKTDQHLRLAGRSHNYWFFLQYQFRIHSCH